MPQIIHQFVSAKSDSGDLTLVNPSNWNASHTINGLPFVDVTDYGAVCDGTDQNTAIQAAITAGAAMSPPVTTIYLPANLTWIAPGGVIPGGTNGIAYYGGNATTTRIKSNATPSSTPLYAEPKVSIFNCNLLGSTSTMAGTTGNGQTIAYYNGRNRNDVIFNTGFTGINLSVGSLWSVTGASNVTPIVLTFDITRVSWLADGDLLYVRGVGGNTAANGVFYAKITGQGVNQVALYSNALLSTPVAGNGFYTTGGVAGTDTAASNIKTYGFGDGLFSDTFGPGAGSRFYQDVGSSGPAAQVGLNGGSGPGLIITYSYDYGSHSLPYPDALSIYSDTGTVKVAQIKVEGSFVSKGHISLTPLDLTVSNGANNNLAILNSGIARLNGPSAPFSITGIVNLDSTDGRRLTLLNQTAQQLSIPHQSASSSVGNKISVPGGGTFVSANSLCVVEFIYDGASSSWRLIGI